MDCSDAARTLAFYRLLRAVRATRGHAQPATYGHLSTLRPTFLINKHRILVTSLLLPAIATLFSHYILAAWSRLPELRHGTRCPSTSLSTPHTDFDPPQFVTPCLQRSRYSGQSHIVGSISPWTRKPLCKKTSISGLLPGRGCSVCMHPSRACMRLNVKLLLQADRLIPVHTRCHYWP